MFSYQTGAMQEMIRLQRVVRLAILASCATVSWVCYADESRTFTLTGEQVFLGLDLKVLKEPSADHPTYQESSESPSGPFVAITRSESNGEGKISSIEVASGRFVDGTVVLEGTVDTRTSLLVTVEGEREKPLTMDVVMAPGERMSFVMFDYASPRYEDELLLVGESRLAEDSDEKFTVRGDLSSIVDKDLSTAIAKIQMRSSGTGEGIVATTSESVLLRDGQFSIEGNASEPLLFFADVRTPGLEYRGLTYFVAEPGAQIRVSPSASSSSFSRSFASELMADSEVEDSMHAKVVETWQNSPDYLAKMDEYAVALKDELRKATLESDEESGGTQADLSEQTEDESPEPYDIYKEMQLVKDSVLSKLVQDLDEPMAALLAMELGAPEARQLEMWDTFAGLLDEDLVARRVVPRRNALEKQIRITTNAKSIVEGQNVPTFTLTNLEGEEIALYDVLAENQAVLVDFWASWCGPCIVTIPKLKELHSKYKDDGFQIVFVSIDESYDEWKGESDRQELPWINVGDLEGGFLAATAVDYGVQWIPTEFLVSPDGKILDREITMEELEVLLAERFGESQDQEKGVDSTTGGDSLN